MFSDIGKKRKICYDNNISKRIICEKCDILVLVFIELFDLRRNDWYLYVFIFVGVVEKYILRK